MLKSFNALVSGTLVSTFKFNEAATEMLAQLMTFEFDFAPLFEALCDKCATILYHVISLLLEREERNCQQYGIISNRINDKNRIKGINNSNTTRVMELFFFSSIEQRYIINLEDSGEYFMTISSYVNFFGCLLCSLVRPY